MRLLVHAQDEITRLEDELDTIDQEESNALFLAANRRDNNPSRSRVLKHLNQALVVYGTCKSRGSSLVALDYPYYCHSGRSC